MSADELAQRDIAMALVSHLETADLVQELGRRGGLTREVVLGLIEATAHNKVKIHASGMAYRATVDDPSARPAAERAAREMFANLIWEAWAL